MNSPPVFVKDMSDAEAVVGAQNAFVVAGMYAATTVLALIMYSHRSKQERRALGAKGASKMNEQVVGIGDDHSDAFSVPLVPSGATGASADGSSRPSEQQKPKKKKAKGARVADSVTTI